MSFSIKRLKYKAWNDNDFDFLSCEYDVDELSYTVIHAIEVTGWFKKEIGNHIYNEKTVDKIVKRIKEEFYNELDKDYLNL